MRLLLAFVIGFILAVVAQAQSGTTITLSWDPGSGTVSTANIVCAERLISVEVKGNTIEIVKHKGCPPNSMHLVGYVCLSEPCDFTAHYIWKEIYGVKDGKLTLLQRVEGKIIPKRYEDERIEWPNEKASKKPRAKGGAVGLVGRDSVEALDP